MITIKESSEASSETHVDVTKLKQQAKVRKEANAERIDPDATRTDEPAVIPILETGWQKLDFSDPAEMLAFYDPAINAHTVIPHKWQTEEVIKLAAANATSRHPFKYVLCAANGSGKDYFIISPFAVWFILSKIRSRVIITSASGVQLSQQTENYIRALCNNANRFHEEDYGGQKILDIKQRHITCRLTGSEILLFATDEESRAEGYHPLESNGEMAIIVNEAKSVAPDIFRALRRCTGYNYWLNVSSTGEPVGDFFNAWCRWPNKRKITYYDCPHLSPEEFESDKEELGEHSFLFRSKWLSEFTFIGGNTVVNSAALERLKNKILLDMQIWFGQNWPIRIGIDLAAGGDETVVSICRGNKQLEQWAFQENDTVVCASRLENFLIKCSHKYQITKEHQHIFADDGGIGKSIIDMLRHKGWKIKRVRNNSQAKNTKLYRNRGAEQWSKINRFIESEWLWPTDDEKLWSQLASRHVKKSETGSIDKMQLMTKIEERSKGHHSPDRADAYVLSFTDVSYEQMNKAFNDISTHTQQTVVRGQMPDELRTLIEERIYADVFKNASANLSGDAYAGDLHQQIKKNGDRPTRKFTYN